MKVNAWQSVLAGSAVSLGVGVAVAFLPIGGAEAAAVPLAVITGVYVALRGVRDGQIDWWSELFGDFLGRKARHSLSAAKGTSKGQ